MTLLHGSHNLPCLHYTMIDVLMPLTPSQCDLKPHNVNQAEYNSGRNGFYHFEVGR